jgi:GNAT superfamily N-acetyltransferase
MVTTTNAGAIGTFVLATRAMGHASVLRDQMLCSVCGCPVKVELVKAPKVTETARATVGPSIGESCTILSITPMDADALRRFHCHLSLRSVKMRYFYPHVELSLQKIEHFTNVDGVARVALVVEHEGELIAVGRYDRLQDHIRAEVAFVVADAFQHLGLATRLLNELSLRARAAGITEFVAEVLAENAAMLSVFHATGYPTASTCEWGTVRLTIGLVPVGAMAATAQTGALQSTRVPPPSTA